MYAFVVQRMSEDLERKKNDKKLKRSSDYIVIVLINEIDWYRKTLVRAKVATGNHRKFEVFLKMHGQFLLT